MTRRVIFSAEAREDLRNILAYVAADSPRHALLLVGRLEAGALDLAESAFRFAEVSGRPGTRRRVVGGYNIYYAVTDAAVEIMRVLHAARDHERLLFPDD